MTEKDPLAALSTAARQASPKVPQTRRPQPAKNPYLLPILLGISLLLIIAGITTFIVLNSGGKEKTPAAPPARQPGDLFPDAKGQ